MELGIDIDRTFARTDQAFVPWFTRTSGVNLEGKSPNEIMGYIVKNDLLSEAMHGFFNSPEFTQTPPMPGAVEVLTELGRFGRNRFSFITARPSDPEFNVRAQTIKWIRTQLANIEFPENDEEFPFYQARSYDLEPENSALPEKGVFCAELGIDVMIDNSLSHLVRCIEITGGKTRGVLFDAENKHSVEVFPAGIVRVENWLRVPTALKSPDS